MAAGRSGPFFAKMSIVLERVSMLKKGKPLDLARTEDCAPDF
jgi:hypothetical protein